MREIEFRAKTSSEVNGFNHKKDGIWVYGFYRDKVGLPVISEFDTTVCDYIDYEVDRNTLGQYTGLKDKNGTKIFEGDIVEFYLWTDYWKKIKKTGYVFWNQELGGWYVQDFTNIKSKSNLCKVNDARHGKPVTIIGNIWDNKSLLKGEE